MAGVLAWLIASAWLDSATAIMAPWVAVVVVQTTVFRSLSTGIRQLGAIATGAIVASATQLLLDDTLVALCVALPLTLLVSNWPRFGDQGVYGATTTLFVLIYGSAAPHAVVDRIRDAGIGAAVALLVNLVILPPLYLRRSESATYELTRMTAQLLRDAARAIRGDGNEIRPLAWNERSDELRRLLEDVRTASEWRRESLRANPRRWALGRNIPLPGITPAGALEIFQPVVNCTIELTHTLAEATGDGHASRVVPECYADFLTRIADACTAFGQRATADYDPTVDRSFDEAITAARQVRDDLEEEVARATAHRAVLGALLIDGERLLSALSAAESS